jgi:catechol 2,3-dioxygenase-like lactoylglutathione lyase family enzyme
LIQGLATLAATAGAVSSASAATPFDVVSIDHVSLQVKDLDKSVNFYKNVFGLPFLNEDKKTETVRLKAGNGRLAIRHTEPYGFVDHFAFGVARGSKAAIAEHIKAQGVTPLETAEPLLFHVMDPDNYPVQIIITDKAPA